MDADALALHLLRVLDSGATCDPVSSAAPAFSVDDAYAVLAAIGRRRRAAGARRVGLKIGFTNRTLWDAYGVDRAFWADIWDRTVVPAPDGDAALAPGPFVQPRIEPEVVFGLRAPVPATDDPAVAVAAVDWMAPGFEIVRCPYPDWRFGSVADCIAAAGFHGALVVGRRVTIDDTNRDLVTAMLSSFEATLWCDGEPVDTGSGANVLGSPALALGHVAAVVSEQSSAPGLDAGDIVTTGTLTNAHPINEGERWRAEFGDLGLDPLTLEVS